MKNIVFWDVKPCGCIKNQRFGGTYRLHHYGEKISGTVTAKVFPSSPIRVTLKM
jgi:hypothetical protein